MVQPLEDHQGKIFSVEKGKKKSTNFCKYALTKKGKSWYSTRHVEKVSPIRKSINHIALTKIKQIFIKYINTKVTKTYQISTKYIKLSLVYLVPTHKQNAHHKKIWCCLLVV